MLKHFHFDLSDVDVHFHFDLRMLKHFHFDSTMSKHSPLLAQWGWSTFYFGLVTLGRSHSDLSDVDAISLWLNDVEALSLLSGGERTFTLTKAIFEALSLWLSVMLRRSHSDFADVDALSLWLNDVEALSLWLNDVEALSNLTEWCWRPLSLWLNDVEALSTLSSTMLKQFSLGSVRLK